MRTTALCLVLIAMCSTNCDAQQYITPEEAVQAVRDFWGDQTIPPSPATLEQEDSIARDGPQYSVDVADHPLAGSYHVRATDGVVTGFFLQCNTPFQPPVLNLAQAQSLAEDFLSLHYAAFGQGTWQQGEECYIHDKDPSENGPWYDFFWNPVIGASGALGPFELTVKVDGVNSRVVDFSGPPDRVTGPTEPIVTREQAIILAAPYAVYDPQVVLFDPVYLRLTEDLNGVQWLEWDLQQKPYALVDPTYRVRVFIDAITGEFAGKQFPMGGPAFGPKSPPNPRPAPALKGRCAVLRAAGGNQVGSLVKPRIEHGSLWIRVELLRGFGASVRTDRKGAEARAASRSVTAASLGGRFHEYGWWIPLRMAAQALGWRVDWIHASKEAIVDTGRSD